MKNNTNKKIILLVVMAILLVISAVIITIKHQPTTTTTNEPEPLYGSSVTLNDKDEQLTTVFTSREFLAVRKALTDYVVSSGGDTTKGTLRIDKVALKPGVKYIINATYLPITRRITFVVNIPSDGSSEPTLSVPAEQYSAPLDI